MAEIKHATDATFEEMVIKAERPVVVDFWAASVRTLQDGRAGDGKARREVRRLGRRGQGRCRREPAHLAGLQHHEHPHDRVLQARRAAAGRGRFPAMPSSSSSSASTSSRPPRPPNRSRAPRHEPERPRSSTGTSSPCSGALPNPSNRPRLPDTHPGSDRHRPGARSRRGASIPARTGSLGLPTALRACLTNLRRVSGRV